MAEVGKTAFITGGASGIGRAVAEMLLAKGANVFIADRDAFAVQNFITHQQSLLGSLETRIAYAQVDVTDFTQQASAFDKAIETFGDLDYVLPIAGIGERAWLKNVSPPDGKDHRTGGWENPDLTVIDVDLKAVLLTCSLAIQHFRRRKLSSDGWKGKIICVASICGIYAIPTLPIYTAAKHGIVGFVRSYGKLLIEENVTLNAICPGIVKTNISTDTFYDSLHVDNHAGKDLVTPMSRVLEGFTGFLEGGYDVSGVCLEVGPGGSLVREEPEVMDEVSGLVNGVLNGRGRSLHGGR